MESLRREMEVLTFENMGLEDSLMRNIRELKYKKPTHIQTKIIPLFMEGKDIVCCSKTGSGKTAAYMIPLVNRLKSHSATIGTRALVLVPSRELALQTTKNLRELIRGTDLRYCIIIGGHDYEGQFDSLASNPDIVVATPGRVMEILQETQFSLSKVEYLIIDEADCLFEMGFAPQIREILKKIAHRRQTVLLSATIPAELSVFASSGLKDFALVKVDSEFKLPDKAAMHFLLCRPEQKLSLLVYILQRMVENGQRSIIFVSSRHWGDYIDSLLPYFDITSTCINGKMHQVDRTEKMGMFNRKEAMNLIVTDLGARGIDLPFVRNVINFDFPQNPKLFIHRCGRTARADKTGTIYSLFTPSEKLYLGQLRSKIERSFVTKKEGGVYNYNHIYYGKVPENIIFSGQECISRALKEDKELRELETTAKNSSEKFEKTRMKADQISKRFVSEFDFEAFHPYFEDQVDYESVNLLQKMKQYKPRVSHFGYEQSRRESKSDLLKLGSTLEKQCQDYKSNKVIRAEKKAKEKAQEMMQEERLVYEAPAITQEDIEREQKVVSDYVETTG